ncbi:MAG: T9SS type A sorting domain-containing protein, partial [Melioribacteraceae bacterium]|nr:T9SS type A sorting domain-containing protein [Melioribacteraceae bacterium]
TLMITLSLSAQNIEFTFANAETTNDGANDFYEVDVMIATVDGQADFKLGKGQIYINYNSAAFGTNINSAGGIEITYPEPEYFLGKVITLPVYTTTGTGIADNSSSRISFAYQQSLSSGTMTDNITSIPTKLFHLKMQFINVGELPMVAFEDDETQVSNCRDQFETACGPFTPGFALADCSGANAGVVFNDANFDSGGATLSINKQQLLTEFNVYPNPTKDILYVNVDAKSQFRLVDMFGKIVISGSFDTGENELQLRRYEGGVYFLRVFNGTKIITKKIVLE